MNTTTVIFSWKLLTWAAIVPNDTELRYQGLHGITVLSHHSKNHLDDVCHQCQSGTGIALGLTGKVIRDDHHTHITGGCDANLVEPGEHALWYWRTCMVRYLDLKDSLVFLLWQNSWSEDQMYAVWSKQYHREHARNALEVCLHGMHKGLLIDLGDLVIWPCKGIPEPQGYPRIIWPSLHTKRAFLQSWANSLSLFVKVTGSQRLCSETPISAWHVAWACKERP